MQDVLILRNLELSTRIGVPKGERKLPQKVLVTVEMALKGHDAAPADSLKGCVDYDDVRNAIFALGEVERKTIERLAEDIANAVLRFAVSTVTVTVTKFPFGDQTAAEMRITRS